MTMQKNLRMLHKHFSMYLIDSATFIIIWLLGVRVTWDKQAVDITQKHADLKIESVCVPITHKFSFVRN